MVPLLMRLPVALGGRRGRRPVSLGGLFALRACGTVIAAAAGEQAVPKPRRPKPSQPRFMLLAIERLLSR